MPFPGYTLPLPFSKNQNREKVFRVSHEKFYRPIPKMNPIDHALLSPQSDHAPRHHNQKHTQPNKGV